MKCGYCGSKIEKTESKTIEKPEIASAEFVFEGCNDHPNETLEHEGSVIEGLIYKKRLVETQIQSLESLEQILQEKQKELTDQLSEFCSINRSVLSFCDRVSSSFEANFEKLNQIEIPSAFQTEMKPRLQDYFNHEDLSSWALSCRSGSARLARKLDSLEQNLRTQISDLLAVELAKVVAAIRPLKTKLSLHELTFKAVQNEGNSDFSSQQPGTISALKEIYDSLHSDQVTVIKELASGIIRAVKRTESVLNRNKYLIVENIEEISKKSKIISIFESFDQTFSRCIDELRRRSKFGLIYRSLLTLLNNLAKQENLRRVQFINVFSSMIPSQVFPSLKSLFKSIKLEKINELAEVDAQVDLSDSARIAQTMSEIEAVIVSL